MTVRRINSTFCSLPLKWKVLHPSLLRNSPLSKALEARIIGWAGPENSVRFYQQFCPKSTRLIRISSVPFPLIQVPRMTNDRAEICEHNSQLRENYFYTSLHFLVLPYNVVEHWHEDESCLRTALVHTVIVSWVHESVLGSQILWILEVCFTRSPSSLHQYDSNLSNDSVSKYHLMFSFQTSFGFVLYLPEST